MKYYVVDTSSLLRLLKHEEKLNELLQTGYIAITERVLNEIKDRTSKLMLNAFLNNISVINPSSKSIKMVLKEATSLGNTVELSDTDISIIALALELKRRNYDVEVLTEDYAIQNVCETLGISFSSILKRRIRVMLKTLKKCLVCGTIYDPSLKDCPNCGSTQYKLIKRRSKKTADEV